MTAVSNQRRHVDVRQQLAAPRPGRTYYFGVVQHEVGLQECLVIVLITTRVRMVSANAHVAQLRYRFARVHVA